jgi:hypothetical protein
MPHGGVFDCPGTERQQNRGQDDRGRSNKIFVAISRHIRYFFGSEASMRKSHLAAATVSGLALAVTSGASFGFNIVQNFAGGEGGVTTASPVPASFSPYTPPDVNGAVGYSGTTEYVTEMINGYFGPRRLAPIGFSEHKVDQAWIIDRGRYISDDRLNGARAFVKESGVKFHWGEDGANDFDENATREQLRDYLTVLDLVSEFRADCVGWQYQLGLVPLRPPSDFAEGLLNSVCRPESNGDVIITSTEGDQGNLVPMELMKRLLKTKGLHQGVMFHDVRWGAEYQGRFLWVLLNSGSCGGYAMSGDPDSLMGVHSYRQPAEYFPIPGGTFAGEALPGDITWARAYLKNDELWMDVGKGEVLTLPEQIRERWWRGTTRQWPFMAADLGISRETLMAHYLSNHIAVAYGDILEEMAALSQMLGFRVRFLGRSV